MSCAHRIPARQVASQLEVGDIDGRLAAFGAQRTDEAWKVAVPREQHVAGHPTLLQRLREGGMFEQAQPLEFDVA